MMRLCRGLALLVPITVATLVSACSELPPAESVESFAQDPARIKEIMQKCRLDRAAVGEKTCRAAAEAARIRFIGRGGAKYTPGSAGATSEE